MKEETKVLGKPSQISATRRISFSLQDNRKKDIWYALEYTEVRDLPTDVEVDLELENEALWKSTQDELQKQANEVFTSHREQFK